MQVVYVDILFIINFCMDYIALYISGYILHIKRKKKLIALSALFGGIYAVLSIIFEGNSIINLLIGIAVSFLLCYVAYNKEVTKKRCFRLCAVFYFVSLLLGGAITSFYNLLSMVFSSYSFENQLGENKKTLIFVVVSLFCATLIAFFSRLFVREVSDISCKLTVCINGKSKTVCALIDSGNFLTEPISGKKVIIINYEAVSSILSYPIIKVIKSRFCAWQCMEAADVKRIRIIPVKSIAGENLITGYVPDSLKIEFEHKSDVIFLDAIIGFDVSKEKFAGYDAIIPHSLL